MADPGFPVGGGAWTPEVATLRNSCMSKRKNMDPWARPLDPPMHHIHFCKTMVVSAEPVLWNIKWRSFGQILPGLPPRDKMKHSELKQYRR